MAEEDRSQKTEEPTEKKLRDARRKGDVPQSRETGTAMVVFALLMIVIFVLPSSVVTLVGSFRDLVEQAAHVSLGSGTGGVHDTGAILRGLVGSAAGALAPVVGILVMAALAGVLLQGETTVSFERIRPKPSKINPGAGFKRLFSGSAFVEFLKNVAKVLAVGVISGWVIWDLATSLASAKGLVPETLASATSDAVRRILIATTVFLMPVALADVIWKRTQWRKKQRMSLKEVRDETKDSEGDPQIRARRAQLRRTRARQRMAQAVPTASVVLTNPTHYAIALRYEDGVDEVPVCVAKGSDLMAMRIRELAREAEVPIVENKPLARALHASIEVDDAVPMEHWQAVAEIIGFVMGLKRNRNIAPPKGSSLRPE